MTDINRIKLLVISLPALGRPHYLSPSLSLPEKCMLNRDFMYANAMLSVSVLSYMKD